MRSVVLCGVLLLFVFWVLGCGLLSPRGSSLATSSLEGKGGPLSNQFGSSLPDPTGAVAEDALCKKEQEEAQVVIEFSSWNPVSIVSPKQVKSLSLEAGLQSALDRALKGAEVISAQAAVVLVPNTDVYEAGAKISEEWLVEIDDLLRGKGFSVVRFQSTRHALCYRVYPDGLPSASEIADRKKMLENVHDKLMKASERKK